MSEEPNARERLATVDEKLDQLAHSVDERFKAIDARFDAVDVAFVEQRQYTEFAFEQVSTGLTEIRTEMRAGFYDTATRFDRFERKLDQFIDTQSRTNALVERRLTALEPPSDDPAR